MLPASAKPYLLRALYEWCIEEGYTPHVVVQVDEHCHVPMAYVRDGSITLNVGPLATKDFFIDNEWVSFSARFNGVSQMVSFPITAVAAIFTRETQEGMGFEVTKYQGKEPLEQGINSNQTEDKSGQKTTGFKLVE
ncbi:peptidase [Pelistega indica]|uniref:Peptidase n=2 Tax=Pelistega TaxID=106146 RepID=V8G048_9BURK|nr:ClpXP protease specificity-enhancing factor [Pelistega indica]ETD69052.1 peptidase [Pelistega indica]